VAFGLPLVVPRLTWIIPGREMLGHQFLYWFSVAAGGMLRIVLEARESERRAARLMLEKSQLETSLRQTELDALRMRLQPHFLFNSLQNIAVLTEHDPRTGSRMLTRLGDLLRASLGRDSRPETTLEAEIALTNAYLAIEQMRFGDRLSSTVDVGEGTGRALVPSFLLQPIVENAIRHGLRDVRQRGVLAIRSRRDGGALVLSVTDNGAGPPGAPLSELPLGIGLGATCERLARMYPGRHSFSMRAAPEGGTEVRITLPLRFEAETEEPDVAYAAGADRRR
jgi:LytS/YehU family sensor histidine kinase